jgi:type II pantothenate kinase
LQKQTENACALEELEARINYLDSLDVEARNEDLIWGAIAGNVLDWGAKAVTNLLEGPDPFGFAEARRTLQKRPWLVDCLDEWLERLRGPPHQCVTIFVDNSGFDFVLGMIPLIREFLRRGTQVILCANSHPAVNDMTFAEMVPLLRQVAAKCGIIKAGLDEGNLIPFGSGQGSPCLDLSRVSQDLISLVQTKETDLVIIEGMGRTIHTNLYAKFKCEVVKMAVIKNQWLAQRLGGEVFSIIFSYEKGE